MISTATQRSMISVWRGFGIANAAIIVPPNLCSLTAFIDRDDRPLLTLLGVCIGLVCIAVKAGVYILAGPIGAYRIALGYNNWRVTANHRHLDPIIKPGYIINEDRQYFVAPFGDVSWWPLSEYE